MCVYIQYIFAKFKDTQERKTKGNIRIKKSVRERVVKRNRLMSRKTIYFRTAYVMCLFETTSSGQVPVALNQNKT